MGAAGFQLHGNVRHFPAIVYTLGSSPIDLLEERIYVGQRLAITEIGKPFVPHYPVNLLLSLLEGLVVTRHGEHKGEKHPAALLRGIRCEYSDCIPFRAYLQSLRPLYP